MFNTIQREGSILISFKMVNQLFISVKINGLLNSVSLKTTNNEQLNLKLLDNRFVDVLDGQGLNMNNTTMYPLKNDKEIKLEGQYILFLSSSSETEGSLELIYA